MSLEAKLDEVLAAIQRLEKKFGALSVGGGAAPDVDLDGAHGNPVVRKDPKRWSGDSFVGCKFSECSPEYLEEVASFKDWQAQMDERKGTDDDRRKAKFNRLDAARARGWAQRLRSGWQTPVSREPGDDDVPFA